MFYTVRDERERKVQLPKALPTRAYARAYVRRVVMWHDAATLRRTVTMRRAPVRPSRRPPARSTTQCVGVRGGQRDGLWLSPGDETLVPRLGGLTI